MVARKTRKPKSLSDLVQQARDSRADFEAGEDFGNNRGDSEQPGGNAASGDRQDNRQEAEGAGIRPRARTAERGGGRQNADEKEKNRPGKHTPLVGILDIDLEELKNRLGEKNSDVIFREFIAGGGDGVRMALLFIDGLADKDSINGRILKTLMVDSHQIPVEAREGQREPHSWVKEALLTIGEVKEVGYVEEVLETMLSGDAVLLVDGSAIAVVSGVKGWASRGIGEPETEAVVRGSREGFVETLRINTAMVRRRLRTPDLRVEAMKIGERTKTDVALLFIEGLANVKLVDEVRLRLKKIKIDGILDSGYIEQFIEDEPFSPFPQMGNTERPDRVVGYLLEGRVAIIVDGTPFALILPTEMNTFMHSPEDYYDRPLNVSFLRFVRATASISALLLPALYVAVVTFHPELLPTPLALSLAAGREGKPFPPVVEVLLMEFVFETLREAGVRLPRPFGQAIGIVGAIVIGQAAVAAGLVGPMLVIIVSLTAIATFAFPSFLVANSIRILRFPLVLLAAISGLYGVVWGLMAISIHLMSLRSFGVPYFYPWAPASERAIQRDTMIRAPLWLMRKRPDVIRPQDEVRQKKGMKPGPDRWTKHQNGDDRSGQQ